MRNRRIACVDIRDFGLEVRLRAFPDLRTVPAVLAATATDAAPILELNERARCRELYAGMTVAQGHARVPEMRVEIRDDHEAATVSRTIVKALQVLSPSVEEERAGLYYLEALGNGRLYKNERLFALRVIAAVNACGFPAALGVAANRSVAKIAAGISKADTCSVIPAGRERAFLSSLSVDHLNVTDETRDQLQALGLSTLAQVSSLPAAGLAERFGKEGALAKVQAGGGDPVPFVPETLKEEYTRQMPFPQPLFCEEMVIGYVERMLRQLFTVLRKHGQGCFRVCVMLDTELPDRFVTTLTLARPTLHVPRFIKQLQQKLSVARLSAGIRGAIVSITGVGVLPAEQVSIEHSSRETNKNAVLPREIYAPVCVVAALPEESFAFQPVTGFKARTGKGGTSLRGRHVYSSRSVAGLRLLQPPEQIKVVIHAGVLQSIQVRAVLSKVHRKTGPWMLSGRWWSSDFHRLYYDVETSDALAYLIFFDRLTMHWFLQGVFD